MCNEIYYVSLQGVGGIAIEKRKGKQLFVFKLIYPIFPQSNLFFVIIKFPVSENEAFLSIMLLTRMRFGHLRCTELCNLVKIRYRNILSRLLHKHLRPGFQMGLKGVKRQISSDVQQKAVLFSLSLWERAVLG